MNTERLSLRSNGKLRSIDGHKPASVAPSPLLPSMPSPELNRHPQEELLVLRRERLDLHTQLFEAAQIQRKLSGPRTLRQGSLQFASEVFAARFLSGDFTTFLRSGSNILAVHGDIAGKGIAAGMWFTNLVGLLQCSSDHEPQEIASEINCQLCYLRPVAPLVTAFFAQFECELGALRYCNAGHFPPVLLRADGKAELLDRGGPLLGAIESAEFKSGELILEPGDKLVAYSDGVLECCNAAGEEFGLDRLLDALRCSESQSAHSTLMTILATLQDYADGSPLTDDVSVTVIQRDKDFVSV